MPVMAMVCQRACEVIVVHGVEERPELLSGPGMHLLGAVALLARWVGGVQGIAARCAPSDGVLAGFVQAGVHVTDGVRREALLAVASATLGELGIEGVDLTTGELGSFTEPMCGMM